MPAPGNYTVTPKTYIRWDDRIESLYGTEDQLFSKFVGEYTGQTWLVNHNLKSGNLLIGLWKYDATNPAAFWKVEQNDYENLTVHWTMPVTGRVVLYSIRSFVGVAMVFDQATPATTWTITHNFGTESIIYTCWVDGKVATPVSAQTLDKDTVELTFLTPVKGSCVLVISDPDINPSIHVDWNNIYNLPGGFPPLPHTHDAGDITGIGNVTSLDGHTIEDFVLKTDVGKSVAPLALENAADTIPRLPVKYLPSVVPFWVADEAGAIEVNQLFVISKSPHPLFLQKVPGQKTAYLDIKPVLTKIALMGNVDVNAAVPDNAVEVSSDYLIRLRLGTGIAAKAEDKHTLTLYSQHGVAKSFTRPSFPAGAVWNLTDSIFDTMGNYSLAAYETIVSTTTDSGDSNHISGQTEITQPFQVLGDDMLEINDNITADKIIEDDNHFVYADQPLLNASGTALFVGPSDVDAVYWDPTTRQYILRSADTNSYIYRTFDPVTKTVAPMNSANYSDIPEHTTMNGGLLYALNAVAGGGFELLRDNPSNMPFWSWTVTASFPLEPMPVVSGTGRLIFRVTGTHLIILNTSINSLAVYDLASGSKLHEKALPKTAKDFDVWPDGYISIAFDGEDSLWTTDKPVWDFSYTFRESIDFNMGDTAFFALRDDDKGALGINPPTGIQYSTLSRQGQTQLYAYGETTIWLKSPFAWTVSPFWSQVLSFDWEDYDISHYADVRIGFFPGKEAEMPSTLYRWVVGTGFVPFAAPDLPTLGQTLAEVANIQLSSKDEFSYAIYIRKSIDEVLNQSFIQHNFKVQYRTANAMYPLPIGGPANADHLLIKCGVGTIAVTNTLGRDLSGVRLVAIPAV